MLEHQQLDQHIAQWLASYQATGKPLFCRRGCDGCCRLAVHATWPESAALAGLLTTAQSTRLAEYVKRLLEVAPQRPGLKDYLRIHRRDIGPCPFLDEDGACTIYSRRPLSCRALLSTRPADWCTVDFSELDAWDKQAYESGLDRTVVAWPTHYVAASQERARELEGQLLAAMLAERGWALSGNFALMVWLEQNFHLNRAGVTGQDVAAILREHRLDDSVLLALTTETDRPDTPA